MSKRLLLTDAQMTHHCTLHTLPTPAPTPTSSPAPKPFNLMICNPRPSSDNSRLTTLQSHTSIPSVPLPIARYPTPPHPAPPHPKTLQLKDLNSIPPTRPWQSGRLGWLWAGLNRLQVDFERVSNTIGWIWAGKTWVWSGSTWVFCPFCLL